MLRDSGFGVKFVSSLSGSSTHFAAYVFVDDCDMCHTADHPDVSTSDLLRQMQDGVNLWEGGLRATGGALVPSKSHWYLVQFLWDAKGAMRYATTSDVPATLSIRDTNGEFSVLERLHPSEARRTLGVRLALDGNNLHEFEFRCAQSQQWADRIRAGHLPRSLAWLGLTTTVLKSLEYPLPATTFSEKDCTAILRPVLRAGLSASGIVSTFPRALVHAPLKFQGLGLPHLFDHSMHD